MFIFDSYLVGSLQPCDPAGKGLNFCSLVFLYFCQFPIWCSGFMVLDRMIPDLCVPLYFYMQNELYELIL